MANKVKCEFCGEMANEHFTAKTYDGKYLCRSCAKGLKYLKCNLADTKYEEILHILKEKKEEEDRIQAEFEEQQRIKKEQRKLQEKLKEEKENRLAEFAMDRLNSDKDKDDVDLAIKILKESLADHVLEGNKDFLNLSKEELIIELVRTQRILIQQNFAMIRMLDRIEERTQQIAQRSLMIEMNSFK